MFHPFYHFTICFPCCCTYTKTLHTVMLSPFHFETLHTCLFVMHTSLNRSLFRLVLCTLMTPQNYTSEGEEYHQFLLPSRCQSPLPSSKTFQFMLSACMAAFRANRFFFFLRFPHHFLPSKLWFLTFTHSMVRTKHLMWCYCSYHWSDGWGVSR